MSGLHYEIAAEIFERFPGYVRGVVVAHGVSNGPAPDALVATLREAETSVRERLSLEGLAEHPRIKSWREAYRAFGAKPSEFRSSIEALARRALRNEPLPSINALVDIGTIVSLRHLTPVGGHAIDVCITDIALRLATGKETFVPFGSDKPEQPLPGEVIFAEGDTILTRRWTWRQANHTLTLPETTAIEFNVDGLPPVAPPEVEQACAEIQELVQRFCGGHLRRDLLTQSHPRMPITP
ncbi:MAG: cytoplasmic protein [candidate division NC10 bacterium]|nr:cytoplasmic protein [candidate division NC10 bacterium]